MTETVLTSPFGYSILLKARQGIDHYSHSKFPGLKFHDRTSTSMYILNSPTKFCGHPGNGISLNRATYSVVCVPSLGYGFANL